VMIGSRGPNISSVMIAESSGGFSSIVGSMYLGQFRERTVTPHVSVYTQEASCWQITGC
jgi:hypothetical protein